MREIVCRLSTLQAIRVTVNMLYNRAESMAAGILLSKRAQHATHPDAEKISLTFNREAKTKGNVFQVE